MNFNKKHAALISSTCLAVLLGGAPAAWAAGSQAPLQAEQQAQKITGTVLDANEDPVIGASVTVKGTNKGVVTNIDGNFSIDAAAGQVLVVSYVGYYTQDVKVDSKTDYTIYLQENATTLDEVVAVGYGVQKKKLVTGATVQVNGDDIAKMNTTNALTAMQSTSPGVQITQSSTQPGSGFKVNIRGMGTIGDSAPLLIIDGVNSGTANDGLNGLNPNDIESIDILKDAASAAIYGARAANGVILVTTKQGKAGKVTVQYDGYAGWANPYKFPSTLNAQQYMQVINETNFNTFGTATDWSLYVPQAVLDRVNNGWKGTNWFDVYRNKNAFQTSHAISFSGGKEDSYRFNFALNYSKNEGTMGLDNASNYERYGGRVNSEFVVVKAADRNILTVGENISFWYHGRHDLPEGNGYWSILQPLYSTSPLVDPYNADGTVGSYDQNHQGYLNEIYSNPLNGFLNGQFNSINKNRDFGVGATVYWIVEPIKNLRYRGQFNTGFSGSNSRSLRKPYSVSYTDAKGDYELNQSEGQSSSFTLENTISYILPAFGKNHIDVLVGQSLERSNWSTGMSMRFVDSAENLNSLVLNGWDYAIASNFSNMVGYSGYSTPLQGSLVSFFGRLNYNYDEKYLLTAIFRSDASSNFARGHRWGTFPSVSAGWIVSNESFMESIHDTLDFLKIRASWGQNGNCNIAPFTYLSNIGFSPTNVADYGYKFSSDMVYTVSGEYQTGAYAMNVPNPDVTWETSEQLDLGFDARFINSRLGVTFDWYQKKTKDWLVQAPMNDITGYEKPAMINGGDVKNTGVELALTWNDHVGDFMYHVNVNAAYNKNEVTRLATASGKIGDDVSSALFQGSSYVSLVEVGKPIGYFSGMSYSGIWQTQAQIDAARAAGKAVLESAQPGDMIWDDYDGNGIISSDGDRHMIGKPNPDWTLGVNAGFSYKGFDFAVAGSGAFGHQIMQCYRTALAASPYPQYTTEVFNRWHGEGTSNSYPRLVVGGDNNKFMSTLYMHNADYFKIQNVTLGYDFNRLWKGSPFSALRLYVQAQNLYTFTKYSGVDPEVSSNGGNGDGNWVRGIDVGLYPAARTYIVGASIKF